MLHHRTTNPALRAMHVAEREEAIRWRNCWDYQTYDYNQELRELKQLTKEYLDAELPEPLTEDHGRG